MASFPKNEKGYFHLTPKGWVRHDSQPFPADRLETWRYEMEWPMEDAKEQVTLTKIWVAPRAGMAIDEDLRARFGEAVKANINRNVKLECRV